MPQTGSNWNLSSDSVRGYRCVQLRAVQHCTRYHWCPELQWLLGVPCDTHKSTLSAKAGGTSYAFSSPSAWLCPFCPSCTDHYHFLPGPSQEGVRPKADSSPSRQPSHMPDQLTVRQWEFLQGWKAAACHHHPRLLHPDPCWAAHPDLNCFDTQGAEPQLHQPDHPLRETARRHPSYSPQGYCLHGQPLCKRTRGSHAGSSHARSIMVGWGSLDSLTNPSEPYGEMWSFWLPIEGLKIKQWIRNIYIRIFYNNAAQHFGLKQKYSHSLFFFFFFSLFKYKAYGSAVHFPLSQNRCFLLFIHD